jgi:hypothetical protein
MVAILDLKRRDRVTLTGIIRKLAEKIGDKSLYSMISSEMPAGTSTGTGGASNDEQLVEVGIRVLNKAIEVLDDDIKPWFSDLLGLTVEAYEDSAFDIEVQVIEALMDKRELSDFFTGASRAFKKMKSYAKQ